MQAGFWKERQRSRSNSGTDYRSQSRNGQRFWPEPSKPGYFRSRSSMMDRRISSLEKKVDDLTKNMQEIKKSIDALITSTEKKVQFCDKEIVMTQNVHLADVKKNEEVQGV